ncbi:MAG: hypothetical protein R3344_04105 [Acidobacteriota bacterium]|nr:hypothetical protein [Acidobacteriota bacterium]
MRPVATLAAAAFVLTVATHGTLAPAISEDRVRDGTAGIARTALEGSEIIDVPVTFLGVLPDALGPGYDLYLIRLEGEVGEHVGVAAGMSGSPVYVDGEIVGALGYRFGALPKDAIGGVTPIEDMIAARLSPGPAKAERADRVSPIATPVFAGGVLGPVLDYLAPELERHGFVLAGGGTGAGDGADTPSLEPGSPVGVQLVRGDMNIAATGTVTLVDGEDVYVFGHPFLGSGRVDFPMTTAEVIHTLADQAGSVKLAEVGREVGAVVEDRLTAAVGRLGARASMMPVTVEVRREVAAQRAHFEVARHPLLAPFMVAAVVGNTLLADIGFEQEVTVRVEGTITLEGLPELPFELALSSGVGHPFFSTAQFVSQTVAALYANPFEEPAVEKIELTLDVRDGRTSYVVETVRYDRGPVVPGSEIEVVAVLRSFRGETITRPLTIPIPEGLAPGTSIAVAVGAPQKIEQALGGPLAARLASASDLASYVTALGERRASDRLEAVVFVQARGAVSQGEVYTPLPPTAAHLLSKKTTGNHSATVQVASLARSEVLLDGPVSGGFIVRFEVREKR